MPVRAALAELWRLEPGMYVSPANIYDIRRHPAFRRLREVCRDDYPDSGKHGPDHALVEALRSLGIPAGLPAGHAHLALPVDEAAEMLDATLRATEFRRFHLAPLDIALKNLPLLSFGPAKVRCPDRSELQDYFDLPRLKRYFGHDHEFGIDELSQFPWLIVEESSDIDRAPEARGGVFSSICNADGTVRRKDLEESLGRIEPHMSRFPTAFEDALFFLLLLPWEDWTTRYFPWRGFKVPWVHSVDNDIFSPPKLPPSPDSLIWDEIYGLDEYGSDEWLGRSPLQHSYLDDNKVSDLVSSASDHRWSLVQEARKSKLFETPVAHFLVRAFEADGIDEFLAHITTIEAALGHIKDARSGGIKKNIGKRTGRLLNDPRCGEKFAELFETRCEFVHGRSGVKDISSEDRRAARNLARRVTNALIERADCTKAESREEVLNRLLAAPEGEPSGI